MTSEWTTTSSHHCASIWASEAQRGAGSLQRRCCRPSRSIGIKRTLHTPFNPSVWKIHERQALQLPGSRGGRRVRSRNLLCGDRGANVNNTEAGQYWPVPPPHRGRSGPDQSSLRPGEPLVTGIAPPGKSDSWSDSESGKRLTRVLPGLCQRAAAGSRREARAAARRVATARRTRRPRWERGGDGGAGRAARGGREGAGQARACAARERARSPGRARGWLLLGVEEGVTAR